MATTRGNPHDKKAPKFDSENSNFSLEQSIFPEDRNAKQIGGALNADHD